jgi:hypothetical protein
LFNSFDGNMGAALATDSGPAAASGGGNGVVEKLFNFGPGADPNAAAGANIGFCRGGIR